FSRRINKSPFAVNVYKRQSFAKRADTGANSTRFMVPIIELWLDNKVSGLIYEAPFAPDLDSCQSLGKAQGIIEPWLGDPLSRPIAEAPLLAHPYPTHPSPKRPPPIPFPIK